PWAALEVDRWSVAGHRSFPDDLRQGRVGVGRAADLPRRRVELEGQRRLRDEVRRVRTDDVNAERVVGRGIGDDLGEALVLAADDRLGDGLERDLADLDGVALLLGLRLGQADRGDLGPAVRRAGLAVVVEIVDIDVAGDGVDRGEA